MEKTVGKPIRRKEDRRFLTGSGQYLADVNLDGACQVHIVRSPHPHAQILHIDTTMATAMPGVVAVLTGDDVKSDGVPPLPCCIRIPLKAGTSQTFPDHPILAIDYVRYVGEPVVMVVAETLEQARRAGGQVEIGFYVLPAVADPARALDENAPAVHADVPGNLNFTWEVGDEGATAEAFNNAARVVSIDIINNRVAPSPLEPRGAIGLWNDDSGYTLHLSCQGAHWIKDTLCKFVLTDVPEDKVRVVVHDVGGGFGTKLFLTPEYVLVLWAARRTRRTVRWIADRTESFYSDTHGRDNVTRAELAMDDQCRFLGLRVSTIANMGAYLSEYAPTIPTGDRMHEGAYVFPAVHVQVRGVFTNTGPVESYRGAGRPEATYMIERLVDLAGRQSGIGPIEIRRRNFVQPEAMPYESQLGHIYDDGNFPLLLEEALADADWAGFADRRLDSESSGRYRGFGISSYIGVCAGEPIVQAKLVFGEDETVTVTLGTQSSGQGHITAYSQIVSDKLGIPFDSVIIRQGDTAWMRAGSVTAGSRSIPLGGVAAEYAAKQAIETGRITVAELFDIPDEKVIFENGVFRADGTNKNIGIFEVAALLATRGESLHGYGEFVPSVGTFTNGCHVCEVEIDPQTGVVEIVAYAAVDDFGTIINPLLVAGQVHGGVAQGIGQALCEQVVYGKDEHLTSYNFHEYAMPLATHLPLIKSRTIEIPCLNNPLGTKGMGEAGAIAAPPAVVNAALDALWGKGVRRLDMPLTAEKVWLAIR